MKKRTIPGNIEKLIEQAHQIFSNTSVLRVIDMERGAATAFLHEVHESANGKDIERYLDVLDLLKIETGS